MRAIAAKWIKLMKIAAPGGEKKRKVSNLFKFF